MTKSGQYIRTRLNGPVIALLLNELDIIWILKSLKTKNLKKSGQNVLICAFALA